MIEGFIGAIIGGGLVGIIWMSSFQANRTKDRVQQEKEYVEVQGLVDEIVTKLERIIYRRRP
jgi:hypothetical protein